LVEEDQACKIKKFNSVFLIDEGPIDKENSTWGEKFKIGCLRAQLDFFQGLIEFIEGLVARKINLLINLHFNWKKLKSMGWIEIFKS
jgi:hypothetical protein